MSDFENNYRTWHTYLSYLKSAIRLFTCLGVMVFSEVNLLFVLAFGLFFAEIIGIVEEL